MQRTAAGLRADLARALEAEQALHLSVSARRSALRDFLLRGALAETWVPQCGPVHVAPSARAEREALHAAIQGQISLNLRLRAGGGHLLATPNHELVRQVASAKVLALELLLQQAQCPGSPVFCPSPLAACAGVADAARALALEQDAEYHARDESSPEVWHCRRREEFAEWDSVRALDEQFVECEFQVCMCAISIVRFLTDHRVAVPLAVTTRLLETHDVLLLLVPLMEKAPWVRKNRLNGRIQKFEEHEWTSRPTTRAACPSCTASSGWRSTTS
ncbi:unnamed protein product [Prorocentrum cordatum]|uniref:Uncharacterized protein n=1 Tax=Prorocentrum cordatum TaxID=2364126 RepID=A0ABN9WWJ8_9DINO|nr:unnamed protein product [Polarella glacialis]